MVEYDSEFGLDQLPLVGQDIPPEMDVKFSGLRTVVASATLTPEQVESINTQLGQLGGDHPPSLPKDKVTKGATFQATCTVPGMNPHTFRLHLGGGSERGETKPHSTEPALPQAPQAPLLLARQPVPRSTPTAPDAVPAAPAAAWLNVDKTLGPLTVRRLGVGYQDQELSVLADATMKAGPLTIGVDGLGLGVRLDKLLHGELEAEGRLSGLSVDYSTPTLEIGGAFLKGTPPAGYDLFISGLLAVKASKYSFGAVGAYLHKMDGQPSLFLFGELGGEIPGPPPFVLTGLMGGFGYNSHLRIPTLAEVSVFPLIAGLTSETGSGTLKEEPAADAKGGLLGTLESLTSGDDPWVRPADGQIWVAAGVAFSVCELIQARALLTAEFGSGLAISLLGRASASFPLPKEATKAGVAPYANLELDLEAVYTSEKAMLAVDALLTDRSFVLDPACHLTGGFALHCWFDGSAHPGDFVLTLGGYHPQFTPPAHYPAPPRLGINWSPSDAVSITGGSYLALTPAAFMVGSSLDVQYHSGDVRAWLTAHVDALLQWQPFHFDVTAGITLGASLNTHVFGTWSVEVGADFHAWGPPTGGEVTVHVLGIGLTVAFGQPAPAVPAPKLDWKEFTALLPAADQVVQVVPVRGLMPPPPAPAGQTAPRPGDAVWVLSSDGFELESRTAVPASELLTADAAPAAERAEQKVNIRAMGKQGLDAQHRIIIRKHGADGAPGPAFDAASKNWTIRAQRTNVPAALWGAPTLDPHHLPAADEQLVTGMITGARITAPAPAPGGHSLAVDAAALDSTALADGTNPLGGADDQAIVRPPARSTEAVAVIGQMADTGTAANRAALLKDLQRWQLTDLADDDLSALAREAGHLFAHQPLIAAC
ncbi:hypothetical protein BG418_01495 [Streptomyces sp. CBMA152]|nr:hypothetical protein [Streptomyces sp. CBMA152]